MHDDDRCDTGPDAGLLLPISAAHVIPPAASALWAHARRQIWKSRGRRGGKTGGRASCGLACFMNSPRKRGTGKALDDTEDCMRYVVHYQELLTMLIVTQTISSCFKLRHCGSVVLPTAPRRNRSHEPVSIKRPAQAWKPKYRRSRNHMGTRELRHAGQHAQLT